MCGPEGCGILFISQALQDQVEPVEFGWTNVASYNNYGERDMALRQSLYGTRQPIDEDFLAALAFGMPETAGIALGFDRLVMLAAGAPDVASVQWLPVG